MLTPVDASQLSTLPHAPCGGKFLPRSGLFHMPRVRDKERKENFVAL